MTHLCHGTCQNKHSNNLPFAGQNCRVISPVLLESLSSTLHIFTPDVVRLAINIKSSFLLALQDLSITNNFSAKSGRKTKIAPLEHSSSHPIQSGRLLTPQSDRSTPHGKPSFSRDHKVLRDS